MANWQFATVNRAEHTAAPAQPEPLSRPWQIPPAETAAEPEPVVMATVTEMRSFFGAAARYVPDPEV